MRTRIPKEVFLSIFAVLINRQDIPSDIGAKSTLLGPLLKISLGHWIRDMVTYPIIKGATKLPLGPHLNFSLGHKDKG